MTAIPWTKRIPKHFTKTITFDGSAGNGAIGTVLVGTVTGRILIKEMTVYCPTLLVGAGATLKFGCVGNTDGLILLTTGPNILAGTFWQDATPEVGISPVIANQAIALNLLLTVGTANLTAGALEFVIRWLPNSPTGQLA